MPCIFYFLPISTDSVLSTFLDTAFAGDNTNSFHFIALGDGDISHASQFKSQVSLFAFTILIFFFNTVGIIISTFFKNNVLPEIPDKKPCSLWSKIGFQTAFKKCRYGIKLGNKPFEKVAKSWGQKLLKSCPKRKIGSSRKVQDSFLINISHLVHKPSLNNMLLSYGHKIKHHLPLRTYNTHVQPRVGFLNRINYNYN